MSLTMRGPRKWKEKQLSWDWGPGLGLVIKNQSPGASILRLISTYRLAAGAEPRNDFHRSYAESFVFLPLGPQSKIDRYATGREREERRLTVSFSFFLPHTGSKISRSDCVWTRKKRKRMSGESKGVIEWMHGQHSFYVSHELARITFLCLCLASSSCATHTFGRLLLSHIVAYTFFIHSFYCSFIIGH